MISISARMPAPVLYAHSGASIFTNRPLAMDTLPLPDPLYREGAGNG